MEFEIALCDTLLADTLVLSKPIELHIANSELLMKILDFS
jgi:hypothetical protein